MSQGGVAVGVSHLVLGARNRREHVFEPTVRIHELTMVHEIKRKIFALHDSDRFAAIHHARLPRETQATVIPADQVEPKRVERSDPHRWGRFGSEISNSLGQLPGSLVRECQDENFARVDVFIDEPGHATDKRLGLSRPWTGLEKIGRAAVGSSLALLVVERLGRLRFATLGFKLDLRQQKGIEELKRDHVKWCSDPFRNLRSRHALEMA